MDVISASLLGNIEENAEASWLCGNRRREWQAKSEPPTTQIRSQRTRCIAICVVRNTGLEKEYRGNLDDKALMFRLF